MKLNNIKLIATDLDGTILEYGQISNKFDLEMLKKASIQGIHVVVVTGQSWSSGSVRAKLFDVDKHSNISVFSNGSVISTINEFKPIYCDIINSNLVYEFMYEMTKLNIPVLSFTKIPAHCYWNGVLIQVESLKKRNWIQKYNVEFVDVYTFNKYVDVIQLMIFVENEKEIAMLDWFKTKKMNLKLNKMRSNIESIPIYEFINVNSSKGKGVIKLAEYFNININDILIFGDNMNDITMFEVIPNSVAMGNSVQPIKEIAKYLTDTNLNGGVGKFLEMFVLNK